MMSLIKLFPAGVFLFLLPCEIVFSQVTFSGDWEKGITGNGNWKSKQVMGNYSLQRVTNPVRQGQYSARFEVRPGDDPINSSGERSEVLIMTNQSGGSINENESSGTQYYAFSVRLDSAWTKPAADANGAWAIVFQLHGPDALGTSPSVAVSVLNGFSIDLHSGDLDSPSGSLKWKSYPFSNNSLNPGKWVDLVLKIKFAKDFTGSVTVWRRDEGKVNFVQTLDLNNVPTLQYKSSQGGVGSHYWKHGLYRSKQTNITNILWLDGFTRGNTWNDVVCAAYGCTTTGTDQPSGPRPAINCYYSGAKEITLVLDKPAAQNMIMEIYSLTGIVIRREFIEPGITLIPFCYTQIPPGVYFVNISGPGICVNKKIILY